MLNIDDIKEIIKMVNDFSIEHFELEHEGTKIVFNKNNALPEIKPAASDRYIPASSNETTHTIPANDTVNEIPLEIIKKKNEEKIYKIVSPVVGIFYSSSEAESDPFVEVGSRVDENTVVCIVEAMKLFNEIEAGVKGEITEVLVKNGDFVEYNQPLFLVRVK